MAPSVGCMARKSAGVGRHGIRHRSEKRIAEFVPGLSMPGVSINTKSHAAFQHEGTLWFVKDARSRNGTYVDGRRLQSGARAEIESGSQITFGGIATYFVGLARLRRLVDAG